jgi:hypothetical protein
MRLFHYTCDHRIEAIRRDGQLVPNWHPLLGEELVWMTSATASREALGLTSHSLSCDRMAHRLVVPEPVKALPWHEVVPFLPRAGVMALQSARGIRTQTWWVSSVPQVVEVA